MVTQWRLRRPVTVDMPTIWIHNINSIGVSDLVTLSWPEGFSNPQDPDTFGEPVIHQEQPA